MTPYVPSKRLAIIMIPMNIQMKKNNTLTTMSNLFNPSSFLFFIKTENPYALKTDTKKQKTPKILVGRADDNIGICK